MIKSKQSRGKQSRECLLCRTESMCLVWQYLMPQYCCSLFSRSHQDRLMITPMILCFSCSLMKLGMYLKPWGTARSIGCLSIPPRIDGSFLSILLSMPNIKQNAHHCEKLGSRVSRFKSWWGNLVEMTSKQFLACIIKRSSSTSLSSIMGLRLNSGVEHFFSYRCFQSIFQNQGLFLRDSKLGPPSLLSGSNLSRSCSISFLALLSLRLLGNLISELRMSSYISMGSSFFSPKGTNPHMNSNKLMPSEYRLEQKLQPLLMIISGAMQWGVPMTVQVLFLMLLSLCTLAETRSARMGKPSISTMKFSGFRSRRQIPCSLRYSMMSTMQAVQNWASSVLSSPISRITSYSSSPFTNSTSVYINCSSYSALQPYRMKGCFSFLNSSISCCLYLARVWASTLAFQLHRRKQSFLSASLGQPTMKVGPNSHYFSYLSITRSARELMKGLSRFSRACFISRSIIFSLQLMTTSSSPPIISFTRSALISARTPLLSIIMSSSYLTRLLVSSRKSYPYTWDLTPVGYMLLDFFSAPSIITIIFRLAGRELSWDFLMMTLPALQVLIFIRSMIFQCSYLRSLDKNELFSKAHLMKFRNVTMKIWSPSTLAMVSLLRIRQVRSHSALTDICLTVLQNRDCSPKVSVLASLVNNLVPFQTEAYPFLIMQNEEPGSPQLMMV